MVLTEDPSVLAARRRSPTGCGQERATRSHLRANRIDSRVAISKVFGTSADSWSILKTRNHRPRPTESLRMTSYDHRVNAGLPAAPTHIPPVALHQPTSTGFLAEHAGLLSNRVTRQWLSAYKYS